MRGAAAGLDEGTGLHTQDVIAETTSVSNDRLPTVAGQQRAWHFRELCHGLPALRTQDSPHLAVQLQGLAEGVAAGVAVLVDDKARQLQRVPPG